LKSSNLLTVLICRDVDDLCDLNAMLAGLWVGVCWVVGPLGARLCGRGRLT
jgi:hypothetical protein